MAAIPLIWRIVSHCTKDEDSGSAGFRLTGRVTSFLTMFLFMHATKKCKHGPSPFPVDRQRADDRQPIISLAMNNHHRD
jgi:hypothetical protein